MRQPSQVTSDGTEEESISETKKKLTEGFLSNLKMRMLRKEEESVN